jgi:hypothetical protein
MRIVGVPTEARNGHLPKTSQKCYHFSQLARYGEVDVSTGRGYGFIQAIRPIHHIKFYKQARLIYFYLSFVPVNCDLMDCPYCCIIIKLFLLIAYFVLRNY